MDRLSGWVNKTMQKLYFSSHSLVLDPPNGEKRIINVAEWGQKYKIVNFESNVAYEVL